MFRIILFVALGLTWLIPAAHARFVLLDAIFDDKPLNAAMGRQGARFEEPISDPGDSQGEKIVLDSGTDYSVRIRDRVFSGTDALTWAFKDDYKVVDGQLDITLEIRPSARDGFEVVVMGADVTAPPFFRLDLDSTGSLKWSDSDDPTPTSFASYSASDLMRVELAFDMAAGTYNFSFNGLPIRTAEAHGVGSGGIARLRVGNSDDANTLGFIDLDNLFIDQVTERAGLLLRADFNHEPLNQPIGIGGAALGQPVSYYACTPMVQAGVLPTPSLVIRDESTTSNTSIRFELLNGRELSEGDVSLSFVLLVNQLEFYDVYVREPSTSMAEFISMNFSPGGIIQFRDEANPAPYGSAAYVEQVPLRFELAFDMSAGRYCVWVGGQRVVHRQAHGITGRGVGALAIGPSFDTNLTGGMRIDDILVQARQPASSAVGEDGPARPSALTLGAIPNPFNPSAPLRFGLAASGRLRVEILDLAGRRLAVLADRDYAAGDHALRWNGQDDSGRALASGVYFTRLTLAGASGVATASRKLVLLK